MATIANLTIGMSTQTGQLAKGLADARGQLSLFGLSAGGAGARFESFGSALSKGLAALGVFAAGKAAFDFFKGGVKGAVDLNEAVSAAQVVFGDTYGTISGQVDALSQKFGIQKKAQYEVAMALGSIAKGAGYSETATAGFANEFTKLAADLSSFRNISFEEAARSIQAGLSGEAEPLRRFGVNILDANVQQEALALGLQKTGKGFDQHAKTVARASLIMKGLADADGDIERTAGSAANQFRAAGGGVENFATSIGQVLLPAVQSGTAAFNELLSSVVETFESNKETINSWGDNLKFVFDVAGVAVRNAGTLWEIFKLRVGAAVENVIAWVGVIPANLRQVGDYIANNWVQLIHDAVSAVGSFFENLGTNIGALAHSIYEFLRDPRQGLKFDWTPLLDGFEATAAELPELIRPELADVQGQIDALQNGMVTREVARLQSATPFAAAKKPGAPGGPADQAPEMKLAGAAELGSKEAYSVLATFLSGGAGDKPADKTAQNTGKTVELLQETNKVMGQVAAALGSPLAGLTAFALGS